MGVTVSQSVMVAAHLLLHSSSLQARHITLQLSLSKHFPFSFPSFSIISHTPLCISSLQFFHPAVAVWLSFSKLAVHSLVKPGWRTPHYKLEGCTYVTDWHTLKQICLPDLEEETPHKTLNFTFYTF